MALEQQIQKDIMEAMKAKDTVRLTPMAIIVCYDENLSWKNSRDGGILWQSFLWDIPRMIANHQRGISHIVSFPNS